MWFLGWIHDVKDGLGFCGVAQGLVCLLAVN